MCTDGGLDDLVSTLSEMISHYIEGITKRKYITFIHH